ncbi:hypothetical protein UY3_09596 [Chelonia mydas]|uniref:Uncharacterized protein n=1 Tax=Chelonia mydas TaxID=8469 RepID=M7B5Q1_CHEMY|nr:hypothetical protein UY3_09596 [Chelonia mydas]
MALFLCITGTLKLTPTPWLPVLSYIAPPSIGRNAATLQEFQRIVENERLPIHQDHNNVPHHLLKLHNPFWTHAFNLQQRNFNPDEAWKAEWSSQEVTNKHLAKDPMQKILSTISHEAHGQP